MGIKLHIDVIGSAGIDLEEGSMTGDMEKPGLSVDTVWWNDDRRRYGGCVTRENAVKMRDFLNTCIATWEQEDDTH